MCLVPILYSVLGIFITQKLTKATNQRGFFFSPREAFVKHLRHMPQDRGLPEEDQAWSLFLCQDPAHFFFFN